ncbi:type VI secretion system Vgr family protein [Neisseria subflava]|uniref:type VI secretion system Vgr family protein n=2 Tax=Neisseria subflava TaxID=28449 RepID=UPI003F8C4CEA
MTARQSYHLTFARFSSSLSVRSFSASEAVNTAYRVEITATSTDSSLPLSSYLNQRAAFEIRPQEGLLSEVAGAFGSASDDPPAKQWQGIITSCEKLSVSKDETVYRFVLEPRFAAMKHFQTSRLFQHQTVPDIVAAVFKHHGFSGIDYRFQKSRSYSVREYVTQYLESDFDFINRLCEEEGIWYAFEQHEQHGDIVVFGDSPEHYLRSQGLPVSYRPHAGLESVGTEALFNLSIRHNPIVEGIRTADYNYRSADTDLFAETDNKQSEESADNTVLLGKQQHWGLHPKTTDEAQVQTTLLNEANLCRQTVATGSGNVVSMTPMKVFQTDISFPEAPDGWLVLSMEHSGSRDSAYSHTFTAIPAQLAYRPERTTPRPHIDGTLPARVTAAENCTYAYIDDMGRYRVKLPFDLDEWSPGGESRPVRLAKPYAGPEYGIHFPLHEGTEVMLSFVQGNPDRPYISGVMHDSAHTDHIPADWNTRNVIRTWANNKLRMEDQKGQEHIKLSTDYQKSQLNLGHIVDSNREKRGKNGEGFELRTDGWGAVRAGKGILVSAQNQDANGKVLDMDDAISQLEQALSLAKSLNKAAQTANNHNTDEETQRGRLKDALKDLKEAGLIQTAPAGIATATQQSQLHTANENIHLVSGANTDITAGQSLTAHAAESLNLFAQSSGIKMQANQGKVEVQAQNDELQLNALKDATLTSSAGKITIAAKEEILITCKGAYIKLSNGEVEIGSPKVVRVRAPLVVNGSHQIKYPLPFFAGSFSGAFTIKDDKTGEVIPNQKYLLTLPDGQTILGVTNTQGKTITAYSGSPEQIKLELLEDDEIWYREEETFELEVINNEENLILPYENNESEDKK